MQRLTRTLAAFLVICTLSMSVYVAHAETPKERLTRFSSELADVQTSLAQLTAERDKLNAEIAELQAKASPLAEKIAKAKAETERLEVEAAEQQRAAAEAKAEQERIAAEEAEAKRIAEEKAEQERLAAEAKAEQERIAAAEAEKKRLAEEEAEKTRIAKAEAEQADESTKERVAKARAKLNRSRLALRNAINTDGVTLSDDDEAALTQLGEVRNSTETAIQRFAALENQLVAARKTDGISEDDLTPIKTSHELAARRLLRLCEMESTKIDEFTSSIISASTAEEATTEDEVTSSSDIADEDADDSSAEKLATETEAKRIADENAEQERIAAAKAKADEEAEKQRIAKEKAEKEAADEAQRVADAKAKRIADEKAEQERIAAVKAAKAKAAAKEAADEAQRIADAKAKKIADEKAEQKRIAAAEAEAKRITQSQIDSTIIDQGAKTTQQPTTTRSSTVDSTVDSSTRNVRPQQNRVFRLVQTVTRYRTGRTCRGYTHVDQVVNRWQTVKIKHSFKEKSQWSFAGRTYSPGNYCILDNVVYTYKSSRIINGQTWPAGFYKT